MAAGQWMEQTALCWGCVPDCGLVALAELAARNGFPEIHIRPPQYLNSGLSERQIVRYLNDAGVRVGVLDGLMSALPGVPDMADIAPEMRSFFEPTLEQCLGIIRALEIRSLNVPHYLGRAVEHGRMADSIAEIADKVTSAGSRVSLEFIPGTGLPDLFETLKIMELTGRDGVGLLFDTWHFLRTGGTVEALQRLECVRLFEAQVSGRQKPAPDEPYMPMSGRLAPGEGDEPVTEIVRELRRIKPDLVLAVEVFTSERREPEEVVGKLAEATRRFARTVQRG